MQTNAHEELVSLGAVALRDGMASGDLRVEDVVEACLARISRREDQVGAWSWINPDFALEQARRMDEHRASGRPFGPLHGLPVALKDVIDTMRIPTENGCPADIGRVPSRDAFVVERLKAAGAVILGKTVTAELAYLHPGKTRNPRALSHTPGGSSSGSAAAVADAMVPLAIGTQTGGSVIRPASYCGITGFKSTYGAIPRRGVLMQSHSLDTLGVFATDPLGAALLADVLFGQDPEDPATGPAPAPDLLSTAASAPPVPPALAFVRPPEWDRAAPEMKDALQAFCRALGAQVVPVDLPPAFEKAAAIRLCINLAEMAHHFRRYERAADRLSAPTQEAIRDGTGISARDYLAALKGQAMLVSALDALFERYDAILCPAALGPAPESLASTGDSIFNGLWTLCGTPAVTLPVLTGDDTLPMGLQLVGRRGDDARLLRTANWLWQKAARP